MFGQIYHTLRQFSASISSGRWFVRLHPWAQYNALDSYTYQAFDGLNPSAPALVTVSVLAQNDPPTITVIADQEAFGGRRLDPHPFPFARICGSICRHHRARR